MRYIIQKSLKLLVSLKHSAADQKSGTDVEILAGGGLGKTYV